MVSINNNSRILQLALCIHIIHIAQNFVVIVGIAVAIGINIAAQNGVRQLIALGAHLPAAEEEFLFMLSSSNTVQHNGKVTRGGILHAYGDTHTGGDHAVQLVLAGASAHCCIAQQVGQITENLRIENFLSAGHAGFFNHAHIHLTNSDDTAQHILLTIGRGLVQHTLIAHADSTGLIGVQARHDVDFILNLFLHLGQTMHII